MLGAISLLLSTLPLSYLSAFFRSFPLPFILDIHVPFAAHHVRVSILMCVQVQEPLGDFITHLALPAELIDSVMTSSVNDEFEVGQMRPRVMSRGMMYGIHVLGCCQGAAWKTDICLHTRD